MLLVQIERQRGRGPIQHFHPIDMDFDTVRRLRCRDGPAMDGNDRFQRQGQVKPFSLEHTLNDAAAVADIHEGHLPQMTHAVHPSLNADLPSFATGDRGAKHTDFGFLVNRHRNIPLIRLFRELKILLLSSSSSPSSM
ncbi:hypothetical protein PMJ1TS6_34590 [Paenibacillus melissococcoides]